MPAVASTIDNQVAMLSQVVATGSLPLVSTAYGDVWYGELLNGVYIVTLSSPGGVQVGFSITDNQLVVALFSGQGGPYETAVGTQFPNAGAAGAGIIVPAGGGKYYLQVTTGTAGGGPTAWRITRLG